jgi:hypothetical protein
MEVKFEQVIKYLEKDLGVEVNTRPKVLIEGGKIYPPELRDRMKINRQVIVSVYELKNKDWEIAKRHSEIAIAKALNIQSHIGSFTFETKQEVLEILNQLYDYFGQEIDPQEIIQEIRNYQREETRFVMFLPVVEQVVFV